MLPRLSIKGFSSFIAFYSCSRRAAWRSFSSHSSPFYTSQSCLAEPRRSAYKRHLHAPFSNEAPKNPYEVLGVNKDATLSDIKKKYFSLARKYHPDTNPEKSAQDKFREIQDAYDTLKDPKKRDVFDKYGPASQQPGFDPDAFSGASFGGFSSGGFSGFQDLGAAFGGSRGSADLFEQLFGAFGGRGRGSGFSENTRGADIEASIGVSFLDACKGTTKTINISPLTDCGTCNGSGLKEGAKRRSCTTCGGSGTRTFVVDNGFQMASTCNSCGGVGSTVPRGSQCASCGGLGKVRVKKTVKVNVPAGVEDGMTIRIDGAGNAPVTGKGSTGDLLVRVNIASSKVFRRQGNNLYHEARIPFYSAILGGKVRVPTLEGDVEVRLPGGTQQNEEMVLKGRGVTSVYGIGNGDLFVSFSVVLPRSLSQRQRELLHAYADDVEGGVASTTSGKASPDSKQDNVKSEAPTDLNESHTREREKEQVDGKKMRASG